VEVKDHFVTMQFFTCRYYLLSLEHGDQHSLQVFRFTSLWLENTAHEEVSEVLEQHLHHIPSYKFLPVVPQLVPRISNNLLDPFVRRINAVLGKFSISFGQVRVALVLVYYLSSSINRLLVLLLKKKIFVLSMKCLFFFLTCSV
jgi:hypothetical protein